MPLPFQRLCAFAPAAATAAMLAFGSPAVLAASAADVQAKITGAKLTLAQAIERGLQEVPGRVIDIELDRDDALLRYALEIISNAGENIELAVNATNGEIQKFKNEGKASRRDQERLKKADIDLQQAITTATHGTPGTPYEAQLDSHFGTVVYEINVLQQDGRIFEVKVDAATGKIVRTREE